MQILLLDCEMENHKSCHRMLVIPPIYEEQDLDSSSEVFFTETDADDLESDLASQLASFSPLKMQDIPFDNRESAAAIDESLGLEIIDAVSYFQFDIDGIRSVLSKKVSKQQIESYIYTVVLAEPAEPSSSRSRANLPTYSWDFPLDARETSEEVTRESFAPTVLEHMMKHANLQSCNPDLMLCLKEVEPLLHAQHHSIILRTQVLSLLACTMNTKRMVPIRNRLIQKQRTRDDDT